MAKAKDKVVVELNVNSAPPTKFSYDRRGYVLSKTQAALCAPVVPNAHVRMLIDGSGVVFLP